VETLVESVLRPDQQLVRAWYFTARVRNQPESERRQADYLTALDVACPRVEIVEGRFQERDVTCRLCGAVRATYEKETDVNLAAAMIGDAVRDRFDLALVVSADADIAPAIRMARALTNGKRFVVAPPRRRSYAPQRDADGVTTLGPTGIRRAQLPDRIGLPNGLSIERPTYWR
jgi:uncharacterized LabA/DUF88 family protein